MDSTLANARGDKHDVERIDDFVPGEATSRTQSRVRSDGELTKDVELKPAASQKSHRLPKQCEGGHFSQVTFKSSNDHETNLDGQKKSTSDPTTTGVGNPALDTSFPDLPPSAPTAASLIMNTLLLGADQPEFPESTRNFFKSGHATSLRFSRTGKHLASGRLDGVIIIWDMETMGMALKLKGHIRQIQSLSWSRCGRYVLSGSQDWRMILWDLQDQSKLKEFKFEAPVYMAELHPKNHLICVASIFEDSPKLVDMTSEKIVEYEFASAPKRHESDATLEQTEKDAKIATTCSTFTHTGEFIITGTNKGWLNVIRTSTRQTIYSTRICSCVILYIRITPSGQTILINAQDRILRTIRMPNLSVPDLDVDKIHIEVHQKIQDLVNKHAWNGMCLNATGEFSAATTFNNHDCFIWENQFGSMRAILQDVKEEQGAIEWQPNKPLIATAGLESGKIYIWDVEAKQQWSALAPDFKEVQENVDFVDDEDEFDVLGAEELKQRQMDLEDEDEDIDFFTFAPLPDEDPENPGPPFRMPILFDQDTSDEEDELIPVSTGTMRRRSPGSRLVGGDGDDPMGGLADHDNL